MMMNRQKMKRMNVQRASVQRASVQRASVQRVLVMMLMLALGGLAASTRVSALDRSGFESVTMSGTGRRIDEITTAELDEAYARLRRKMFGGDAAVIYGLAWFDFVGETVFSKTNRTQQVIEFSFSVKETTYEKRSCSFGVSVSGKIKGELSKAVDAELDAKFDWKKDKETGYTKLETTAMTVSVSPHERIVMRSVGTGTLANGVTKSYFFWMTTKSTTWEVYEIKTITYEIIEEAA